MIVQPGFPVEPWTVREVGLDLDHLAQTESVFALANGHIGLRGNLEEGEPHGLPGSYLNSCYELRPLPYAEAGYGYPESGQTLINVTNGKILRLMVDDEPLDVRYGTLREHERELDLRAGLLHRRLEWESPTGKAVRVATTRLVSFAQRAVMAIEYVVEAVDQTVQVTVQSELVTNEALPATSKDPRVSAILDSALVSELYAGRDDQALLVHSTRGSGLRVAAAMGHVVDGPGHTGTEMESYPDSALFTVTCVLKPGERLRLVKYVTYGWSSQRSLPAMRDQVVAALAGARYTGWDGLLATQRAYLDDFWDRADVEVDGDAEVQQAVRFALFHVLQAGARAERRCIAAKGLTGPGYDGHAFWDTETFVLQVLTYTQPSAAADALRWRYSTLDLALERAAQLNLRGAAFPWRTIRGQECSAYWPAGTAAFHVNADIADASARYVAATGDVAYEREVGVELLVQTARMWRSLGHHDARGRFRIDGVTGPDEYTAICDNNVYTNLMAQRNLLEAVAAVRRHQDVAHALGVGTEEAADWSDAAHAVLIPYNDKLGVHAQAERFTEHEVWDFEGVRPDQYPLLLHFPYFHLYRKQVVKQADLVLAMHLRGDAFTPEQKARNFAYYERLTVRDSSLSACTQAVLAAEVGHLDLARAYLGEAALMDLHDIEHNTGDGVHVASLAGAWIALVAGLGGMRDHGGRLSFAPQLPAGISRLAFRMCWRGQRLHVAVTHEEATYTVTDGESVTVRHHGEELTVTAGNPQSRPLPRPPRPEPVRQPAGRAPMARDATTAGRPSGQ